MEVTEFELAVHLAVATGFVMETYEITPGITGYQLKNPEGEYVQLGSSEESVWRNAFDRGLLPPVLEE